MLNILRAIEKLSAGQGGQNAETARGDGETAQQPPSAKNEDSGRSDARGFAESLMERHENSVNRIRRGGK